MVDINNTASKRRREPDNASFLLIKDGQKYDKPGKTEEQNLSGNQRYRGNFLVK